MQTQNFHQRANYSPNSFHHCSPPIITSISFHDVRPKFSRWQNDTHSRQTWPLFSGETSAGKIERKIVFLCRLLVPSCRWCCVRVCIIKQFTSLPNSRLCTVPRPANWWRSRKVRVCVSVCVCCSWSGLNCHTIECRTLTPCGTLFFGALGEHIGLPLPSFLHCNFRPHTHNNEPEPNTYTQVQHSHEHFQFQLFFAGNSIVQQLTNWRVACLFCRNVVNVHFQLSIKKNTAKKNAERVAKCWSIGEPISLYQKTPKLCLL